MFRIWRGPAACLLTVTRRMMTEAAGLERQLAAARELLTMVQIPGAGRGLVASKDIPFGTTVFREFPMLVAPSPHAIDQACYHCLKPLQPLQREPQQLQAASPKKEKATPRFCSSECRTSANREYWQVERHCDFGPLLTGCQEAGEKLPLMAARLACTVVTQWQSGGVDVIQGSRIGGPAGGVWKVPRGNAMEDLGQLCFANVPSPPPPWERAHAMLLEGLRSHPSNSNFGSASTWREVAPHMFSLDWYCWVMSHLHINVFRIDTVPALPTTDPSALLKAAAGLISDPSASTHTAGSGAFLLASLLNHSCEPNLEVVFPLNSALVAFTAARDIGQGEQLCISYVDSEMSRAARQEALLFSYGFECKCPRCREER